MAYSAIHFGPHAADLQLISISATPLMIFLRVSHSWLELTLKNSKRSEDRLLMWTATQLSIRFSFLTGQTTFNTTTMAQSPSPLGPVKHADCAVESLAEPDATNLFLRETRQVKMVRIRQSQAEVTIADNRTFSGPTADHRSGDIYDGFWLWVSWTLWDLYFRSCRQLVSNWLSPLVLPRLLARISGWTDPPRSRSSLLPSRFSLLRFGHSRFGWFWFNLALYRRTAALNRSIWTSCALFCRSSSVRSTAGGWHRRFFGEKLTVGLSVPNPPVVD